MFGTNKLMLLLILGLAAIAAADNVESGEHTTVKIEPQPPSNRSTVPTTSLPTTTPTTTTVTTPPTKPPTTTPTTKPTTSTTSTTTTPATTSTSTTTTPAPTTSTTAAPVTTPKPTPMVENTWEVDYPKNKTACVLIHMMAAVDVYHGEENQTNIEQIAIPKEAVATGNCSESSKEQKIMLTWSYNATINDTVEFTFKKNGSNFDLETVAINVLVMDKNSTKMMKVNRTSKWFETPVTMSYMCKKSQMLNFTEPATNKTVATLLISNVQFQAFGYMSDQKFASAKDCEPYETPDIVPIAVGCALIALIVFVLIGYLIGRRRNQTRGYLSM